MVEKVEVICGKKRKKGLYSVVYFFDGLLKEFFFLNMLLICIEVFFSKKGFHDIFCIVCK